MKLNQLTIENTTLCQADCTVCVRHLLNYKLGNMAQEIFEKSIIEARDYYKANDGELDFIAFGGMGEPLLDPELEQKFVWLKSNFPEMKIGVTTNGGALGRLHELVKEYVDVVKISNYGFSKKSFEAIHRGGLKYEEVCCGIEKLLNDKVENHPKVIMSFLMLPENKGEVEKWRRYWEGKCDEIFIWKPHNWGGAKRNSELGKDYTNCHSCGRPGKDFVIRANGDVSVCCIDYNRELIIGNIKRDTFGNICNSPELLKIVKMHENRSFCGSGTLCENCDQLFDRSDALVYTSTKQFKVGDKLNVGALERK